MTRTARNSMWAMFLGGLALAAMQCGGPAQSVAHEPPRIVEQRVASPTVAAPPTAIESGGESRARPRDTASSESSAEAKAEASDPLLAKTLARIEAGERLHFRHDGSVFQNRERRLPGRPRGYYREWVHPTPGERGPGARRVITGRDGEVYYTDDHYGHFTRLK